MKDSGSGSRNSSGDRQAPARPRRSFADKAALKKKPAQPADSPIRKKFEDKAAQKPAPDSPKPWRQRRSAAERKADGSLQAKIEAAEAEDVITPTIRMHGFDGGKCDCLINPAARAPWQSQRYLKILAVRQSAHHERADRQGMENLFRKHGG